MSNPTPLAVDLSGMNPEQAVHTALELAARVGASDLFLLADEDGCRFDANYLGRTQPVGRVPAEVGRRCVAHLKAQAGLDTTEKRRPQDGRMTFARPGGGRVDLRLSVLPTLHGEDMAVRILDRDLRLLAVDQLGLLPRDLNLLLSWVQSPGGLVLVAGPTGCGKTTTLYALLKHLWDGRRKINTIEDPIEYDLPGCRQSQVNPKTEVGFPELLRAVLRQAPSVVMVGEVRDPETAVTAVRAANSGHLVFATLHAPVAAAAAQSLLQLDVPPYFLATSLIGVVSQRLIRTLCQECKKPFPLPDGFDPFTEIRPLMAFDQGDVLFQAGGCPACRGLGYAGRVGVFELMPSSAAIRKLILDRAPAQEFRRQATAEGMIEFRKAALVKVAEGQTNQEEVFRAIPAEYLRDV